MPHDEPVYTLKGTVLDVFAHRFVVQTDDGRKLADFGKHNLQTISIKTGDIVDLTGEQKPSELKVQRMIVNGRTVAIETKDKDYR